MSTHKHFDKVCGVILIVTLLIAVLFVNGERLGLQKASTAMAYEDMLFDISSVHTVDIVMDDWDDFVANCKNEEYYPCAVVIDNEAYKNVGIRGKGNTSLTQVDAYGNDRYSFKIEFDHYDSTLSYYGLDKLCLNNIIQDNTYMKDYLAYRMMGDMGVAAPLCSYVYITVNGEDWGLYLAVEGVEEAFLQRNYGKNYGELYKPDSQSMGGQPGYGKNFDMDKFMDNMDNADAENNAENRPENNPENRPENDPQNNDGRMAPPQMNDDREMPNVEMPEGGMPDVEMPDRGMPDGGMSEGGKPNGDKGGRLNGSDDVLLKYIDDNIESYGNIFENAKTDPSDSDKKRLIAALERLSNGEDLTDTVDIERVIRYFVVHNFVLNFDSYTGSMIHNYYLYEKDGQMQMIPWDYNLSFGGFQSVGGATSLVNYPIDSPISGGNVEDRPMIAWIFADEEYTELYHRYFAEFVSEYFESGYFEQMIDSVSAMIAPYVEKDPTKFCTYEEFTTGVATLREFCLLRAESVAAQLNGTIGTTSETQTEDTLIDAGDLQISDMGSMNNSMGGGMPSGGGGIAEGMGGGMPDNMPENMPNNMKRPPNENFARGEHEPRDGKSGGMPNRENGE